MPDLELAAWGVAILAAAALVGLEAQGWLTYAQSARHVKRALAESRVEEAAVPRPSAAVPVSGAQIPRSVGAPPLPRYRPAPLPSGSALEDRK